MGLPNQLRRRRHTGSIRGGSLIVEAVIAVALLATAGYALTKLAKSSAELSQHSDRRLAATLTAENTIERLRSLPAGELLDRAGEIAESVALASGCDVDVAVEPFSLSDRKGLHVRVDVTPSSSVRVRLHDWRFAAATDTDESSKDTTESSKDTTESSKDTTESSKDTAESSKDSNEDEGDNE